MTKFLTSVAIMIATLLVTAFSIQALLYSRSLQAFAQTPYNSTLQLGNNTTGNGGNITSPQNASERMPALPEAGLEDEQLVTTNDTSDQVPPPNATETAATRAIGTFTLSETGIDNTTADGPHGLTLTLSGRYVYDPSAGLTINQTAGQLVIESTSDREMDVDDSNQSSFEIPENDTLANATGSEIANATLVTTAFNLTDPQVSMSEDLGNITIASDVVEIEGNNSAVRADVSALMAFRFPIDFTADNQTFSSIGAASQNAINSTIDSIEYGTSANSTSGELTVFVDRFGVLEQEIATLNATGQLEEEILRENSTLAVEIQDTMFESLNLTIPTTSELEENVTTLDDEQAPANFTADVLENRIKPLFANSTEEQVQNLTEDQQTLFNFVVDSMSDEELTDAQNIQLNILLDELETASDVALESRLSEVIVGMAAILVVGIETENDFSSNITPTSTSKSYYGQAFYDEGLQQLATSVSSGNIGSDGKIVPVSIIGIIGAILGIIWDGLRDRTPPTIIAPPDITEVATGTCTYVNLYKYGQPYVNDDRDRSPRVTNNAPPCFPLGIAYVKWTATDRSGNSASDMQAVIIEAANTGSFRLTQMGVVTDIGEDTGIASEDCSEMSVASVRASGDDGNVPANTLDNHLGTRWSGFGIGSWIIHDMGEKKVICDIELAWYQGDIRTNDFTISVSEDGRNFTPVYSDVSSGTTLQPERYDISDVIARYVKITVYGNTINDWASITEIDTNGHDITSTTSIVTIEISGRYEYESGRVTVNPAFSEGTVTIRDAQSGQIIEQEDLSPVQISPTQLLRKVTTLAQVDHPLKSGSVSSSMNFEEPVNFKYGGIYPSTENGNVLAADIEDNMYEAEETSMGNLHIFTSMYLRLVAEGTGEISNATTMEEQDGDATGSNSTGIAEAESFDEQTETAEDDETQPASGNIEGTDGDDLLEGTEQDDTILGLAGDDEIYGFGGDDTLDGGPGDNQLNGGEGNDRITATVDLLDDTTWGYNTVIGGNGDDDIELVQTSGDISGGDGNDRIRAVADSGTVDEFTINGGEDDDYIEAVDTPATIFGGGGNDEIHAGGETTHTVYGGSGNDELYLGTDIGGALFGEGGDDYLSSFFGGTLDGGEGDDTLETLGGGDSITLIGRSGADHFICTLEDEETIEDFSEDEGDTMAGECDTDDDSGPSANSEPSRPQEEEIPGSDEENDCDSAYPDVCISSPPPDLNCGDISQRNFEVRSPDPHGFDGDNDGIGCES